MYNDVKSDNKSILYSKGQYNSIVITCEDGKRRK